MRVRLLSGKYNQREGVPDAGRRLVTYEKGDEFDVSAKVYASFKDRFEFLADDPPQAAAAAPPANDGEDLPRTDPDAHLEPAPKPSKKKRGRSTESRNEPQE